MSRLRGSAQSVPQSMTTHTHPIPDRIHNPVQKDTVTFLETSAQSGGTRSLALLEVAPGGAVPPHQHVDYSEAFRVTEGRLTVVVDGQTLELGPGDEAVVRPGAVHAWSNVGAEPAVAEIELRPGQPGFELTLRVGYGLARDGRTMGAYPRNPLHLALMLTWANARLTGPAARLWPVFRLLSWTATRLGVAGRLRRTYGAPAGT